MRAAAPVKVAIGEAGSAPVPDQAAHEAEAEAEAEAASGVFEEVERLETPLDQAAHEAVEVGSADDH